VVHTEPEAAQVYGCYFYGVILVDSERQFGPIGLDGAPVYTIMYRDIAAIVSQHPLVPLKPLRRNLSPFHQTLRSASQHHTTIPAKFGQIAEDEEQVRRLLQSHYGRLRMELERLHSKGEIGVKVVWDVENLSEHILQSDDELRKLRDQLLLRGSPPTRQERIELGGLLYDRINAKRQEVTHLLVKGLRPAAADVRIDEPNDDRMVTTAAFLVAQERRSDFEEAIGKLADLLGQEYAVKVDGPWPPFSFVTHIELQL